MASPAAPVLVAAPLEGRRPASYWRWADAPPPGTGRTPLVAVAGLGLDGRVFRRLAPLAGDRDLLLVNLPNAVPAAPTMEAFAEEVFSALDAAGHGKRKAVLVGSSFGAMVVLAAALSRPERTAAVILLGGGTGWGHVRPVLRFLALFHPLIPRRAYPRFFAAVMLPPLRGIDPVVSEELRVQMFHRTKGFVGACLSAMRGFDARPRLGELAVPTLILHGDRDPVLPHGGAASAAALIPGARLETLEHCGHLPHVSHGERTAATMARFLEEAGL